MFPLSGKHCPLPFLPATSSSPSQTLEGLFKLTRRPSRALDSPRALVPETTALGMEVPRTTLKKTEANKSCVYKKTHFLLFPHPHPHTTTWFHLLSFPVWARCLRFDGNCRPRKFRHIKLLCQGFRNAICHPLVSRVGTPGKEEK